MFEIEEWKKKRKIEKTKEMFLCQILDEEITWFFTKE